MAPVKRKYAFERFEGPPGENYVVKINYPFKDPVLPIDLKGESFCALLGTHCSALELFLIKRKIKGPSWLQVSNFSTCSASQRVSWCKFEVTVDSSKDIRILTSSKISFEIPPVVVAAINLKTILNEKQNVNEIVSASIICCNMVKIDAPMLTSEWRRPRMLTHFTVIRKLDGHIFPVGFSTEVAERNKKAGSIVLGVESSERALLNRLMVELYKLDCDVLVGHNISGFDLEVILHRCQACKVASNMWSKLGRLRRSALPKLDRGSKTFGSGARPVVMSCMAGRLLCDTYLSSRDLLKEVSYSLTELTKTQLKKFRTEVAPHDVPYKFQSAESLFELGCSSGSPTGIAPRARHPDELKREQGKWLIDIEYYLFQQIHPVVSRLCASIQGTSPERLADCLGLDSSKFQHKSSETSSSDPTGSLLFAADDEERYPECEPLVLSCPSCSDTFDCPPVFKSICGLESEKTTTSSGCADEANYNFWRKLRYSKCPEENGLGRISPAMIANQVKRQAEKFVLTYYRGLLMCDDETCKHTTRSISFRLVGDSERGTVCPNYPRCNGRLYRKYTEGDLYKQLSYFCHVLDTVCRVEKVEAKSRTWIEKELLKIRPMIDPAASTVKKIRDRCAYGWVNLKDLVITV